MHLHVLASGSKGNAAVVEGPEGSVLIDDGLSRRELMRRADELGVDMDRVGCVSVTHEHSDHTSGLSVLCNKYEGRLVATAGTAGGRKYLAALPFELVGASDELEACGISPDMVRLSCGLEATDDLIADVAQALDTI